jgi:predicted nucleic acid-binding protein
MKIFLDTSSLFKLYHIETGTKELIEFFKTHTIEAILLAEITKIEFCSVVWKKCRKNEINESLAQTLIDKFESDSIKFTFIDDNVELKESAKHLLEKHWKKGLRTLDSIQLASALSVNSTIDFMFTSDIILSEIAISENIQIG